MPKISKMNHNTKHLKPIRFSSNSSCTHIYQAVFNVNSKNSHVTYETGAKLSNIC
jgi:hypothetical protein